MNGKHPREPAHKTNNNEEFLVIGEPLTGPWWEEYFFVFWNNPTKGWLSINRPHPINLYLLLSKFRRDIASFY